MTSNVKGSVKFGNRAGRGLFKALVGGGTWFDAVVGDEVGVGVDWLGVVGDSVVCVGAVGASVGVEVLPEAGVEEDAGGSVKTSLWEEVGASVGGKVGAIQWKSSMSSSCCWQSKWGRQSLAVAQLDPKEPAEHSSSTQNGTVQSELEVHEEPTFPDEQCHP